MHDFCIKFSKIFWYRGRDPSSAPPTIPPPIQNFWIHHCDKMHYYKTSCEKYNRYFKDDIQKLAGLYLRKGWGPKLPHGIGPPEG